jgi:hypothetical protein
VPTLGFKIQRLPLSVRKIRGLSGQLGKQLRSASVPYDPAISRQELPASAWRLSARWKSMRAFVFGHKILRREIPAVVRIQMDRDARAGLAGR